MAVRDLCGSCCRPVYVVNVPGEIAERRADLCIVHCPPASQDRCLCQLGIVNWTVLSGRPRIAFLPSVRTNQRDVNDNPAAGF